MVEVLNKQSFEEKVENGQGLVLVDFYADWCGPCKMLGPTVEKLSDEYAGKATFAKINVDDNQDIAIKYRVMSIPMLILFKDGKQVASSVGLVDESKIKDMIDQA